jgi:hypothetical protein
MRIGKEAFARIALGIAAVLGVGLAFLAYESTRYFRASELDMKPYPMRRIDIDFPPSTDGIEYFGKLRLDVYIDSQGGVDRVEVVDSKIPARLRDIAVKAFLQARWEPARKWGFRVKSVKVVEIEVAAPGGVDRALKPGP